MIPKTIHYCWLSNNSFPAQILECIDSWHKKLPDYEIVLWGYDRFHRGKSTWVDQAFDCKKYAFAADYIRLYALYYYGGIYLDSDVEVLRPYDELLVLPYFIGQEKTPFGIESATMAFQKGSQFVKDLLDYYDSRQFIRPDGTLDMEPMPRIIRRYIASRYNYHVISDKKDFIYSSETINVFSPDFFSPKHYETRDIEITSNTFSIHHFIGSWVEHSVVETQSPTQSQKRLSFWGHIRKRLVWRKNVNIISTNFLSDALSCKLWVTNINPILIGSMIEKEQIALLHNYSIVNKDSLVFIRSKESKYFQQIKDFYPLARIKDTSFEIHFKSHISREAVIEEWIKLCDEIKLKRNIVVLPSGKNLSRIRLMVFAIKVNMGLTKICL